MSTVTWVLLTLFDYGLAAVVIATILRRRKEPAAMMAWILVILLLPFLGIILYFAIGDPRISRQIRKRRASRGDLSRKLVQSDRATALHAFSAADAASGSPLEDVVSIATRLGGHPPTRGNDVTAYFEADATYLALRLAIEAARSHVNMQYYIFQPDDTGRLFRDLLIRKAREGVRCRLLLDGVGSWSLSDDFLQPLEAAGVETAFFLPVRLQSRRIHLNLRNHRKLVVIDGQAAFTGSQNIGDEYLGRKQKYGPWRDTHLRIDGPAAAQLQEVFLEDWYFATQRDLTGQEARVEAAAGSDGRVVQVVPSGPDRPSHLLHLVLLAAVSAARRSICITTPYFVPDTTMILALQAAAIRGVRVQLLIPSRSDNRVVLWAGRSYYGELLESGVEIYEFERAMLHSKVMVVDEQWAMVGSANMDVRSFRLNFELTTLLYDGGLAQLLYSDFTGLRDRARRIPQNPARAWSLPQSLLVGAARLASPLL